VEQAAAGERPLQSTGKGGGERLAHLHPREVGENAVDETPKLELAGSDEPDQRILCTAERIRERALGGGHRIVALGHVVLVRVLDGPGVGRLIDRARLEQLVQLLDLGRVLLGRRPDGRDHLRKRVELSPSPLGVAHQVLVEHDAEVTGTLAHLLERVAAAAE
jgi:hypothetical protein